MRIRQGVSVIRSNQVADYPNALPPDTPDCSRARIETRVRVRADVRSIYQRISTRKSQQRVINKIFRHHKWCRLFSCGCRRRFTYRASVSRTEVYIRILPNLLSFRGARLIPFRQVCVRHRIGERLLRYTKVGARPMFASIRSDRPCALPRHP
ncbi:hypothetical protein H4582DRAFT_1961546 [Lactarius indigo]|nr:hypothetical protein H4582DRAFT_1993849 [Lactarius indigo]KAI9437054.1 hypothetical protein H4582DRAFT_1961546 [Lactarius indigo]